MTYGDLYNWFVVLFFAVPYVIAVVFALRALWHLGTWLKKKSRE
jgi:hypothetical protein